MSPPRSPPRRPPRPARKPHPTKPSPLSHAPPTLMHPSSPPIAPTRSTAPLRRHAHPPRQFELTTLTHRPHARPPPPKTYSPPETLPSAAYLPSLPPSSPLPQSQSNSPPLPASPQIHPCSNSTASSTTHSRRSHESDIVHAQIHYAIHGTPASAHTSTTAPSPANTFLSSAHPLSPTPSFASSLASSPAHAPLHALPPASVFPSSTPPTSVGAMEREAMFRACLSGTSVDVDDLRRMVWMYGVPDATWARPMVWKLLVEYLPPDRAMWARTLDGRRAEYWAMVADVTVDPTGKELVPGDHPLSLGRGSEWREFWEDERLREVIGRDVERTYPEMVRMEKLRGGLERVLFVYAKRHEDVGYRQGMNELAAVFLLVFMEERSVDLSDVEADAYFCFDIVMGEMKRCYVGGEDGEVSGMERQIREFGALFRIKDPELERHFEGLKLELRFFALRWIRLWLAREFVLPDVLALWDSFLTSEQRLGWVRYVCVAMLMRIREGLLAGDFVECMKLLLHYPPCDTAAILRTADRLRTSNVVIVRKAKRG